MALLYGIYLVPLLIAAVMAVGLAVLSWGRRAIPGAPAMALMMDIVALWALTYAGELAAPTLQAKLLWTCLEYLAVVSLPLIWLTFVLNYSGLTQWARRRNLLLASIIPALTITILWTDCLGYHDLFYAALHLRSDGRSIPMLVPTPGPWYWVNVVYAYGLSLIGAVLAVRMVLRSPQLFRGQAMLLIIGLLAPWIGNLCYMLHWTPVPYLDLTPFGFVVTGFAALWGLLHYRLLDIMPVARAAVVEGMEHGVVVVDVNQQIVDANPAARRILGLSTDSLIGSPLARVLPELPDLSTYDDAGIRIDRAAQGETRHYEGQVSGLLNRNGRPSGWMVTLRDITEHRHAQQALVRSESKYQQLFNTMTEGFALHEIICDADGIPVDYRFLEVNPAFEELTGLSARQVVGRTAREVLPTLEPEWVENYGRVALQGEAMHFTRESAGIGRTFEVVAYAPNPGQFATVFMDITERMQAEARLNFLAYYDDLTGLPNRFLFTDRLGQELAHAARRHTAVGLFLLDLDRFKEINETLGHGMGDRLLQSVSQRLNECVRETDTLARMGGDEFFIILPGLTNPPLDTEITALRLQTALARPFVIDGQDLYISASIGITIAPADGTSVETLMRNADIAMYRAKEQGRDSYCYFSAEMGTTLSERHMLANELRKAIDSRELYLAYQPQVDMTTRRVFGVEALLRWRHPLHGEISPARFIPVAEETGLIEPIGEWVLRTACAQMREWRRNGAHEVSVAVNLSARQFERRHIVETVRDALDSTGLPPDALELEITESTAMQDTNYAIQTLGQLRDLGVRIAIDDFGTGHCSFGYLKRFPVSTLKIDRVFIRDISSDKNNAAIVEAMTVLGQALGLDLIAECVETVPQLHGLQAHGCQRFQGYLFSKPLSPDDCAAYIADADRIFTAAIEA